MSIQQDDLKKDDGKAEGVATETESPGGSSSEDANVIENSTQTDDQNLPAGEDSASENLETVVDEAVEWLDSVENTENTDEIINNETDLDQKTSEIEKKSAELEAKSIDLAAQLADVRDQLLRKAADFENFRKRMNQEKQSTIEFANQTLLLDIIPVIDDFERAIQSAEASAELIDLPAGKALLDGIVMIEKRLTSQLESKWGLKRFNSAGELFDPNRHEAMMMEKSSGISDAIVQEDFAKGYTLKDRVIRAAKVKVLMPEEEGD